MEIAYLGDVLNTASRLMSHSDIVKVPTLISSAVVQLLPDGSEVLLRKLGPVNLRGKEHTIDVYALVG